MKRVLVVRYATVRVVRVARAAWVLTSTLRRVA